MPASIGMHDKYLRFGVRFLDHVRQMMAIIAAQGRSKNDQIKLRRLQSSVHAPASLSLLHGVPGFFKSRRLFRQDFPITFSIKTFYFCFRHCLPSSLAPDEPVPAIDGSNGLEGVKRYRRSMPKERSCRGGTLHSPCRSATASTFTLERHSRQFS